MGEIVRLANAAKIYGAGRDIVAEVMTISPDEATQWLRCNRNNRPVRKKHVAFLASEIIAGNWQVNGQAIVIADDEQVLDGQHRLFAIIEAGVAVKSLVVYGITPDAFRTIDTGAARSGADALFLHFHESNAGVIRAAATAVQWCAALERGVIKNQNRVGNTYVIEYVTKHPSLLQCAETLSGYPKDSRPLSLGCGAALYEMFARRSPEAADKFMHRLYVGEELIRTDVEWVLRQAFIRDANRINKLPASVRMKMVIKGWNWLRRGRTEASHQTVSVQTNDDPAIRIF